jgi:hypothetical protein
MKSYKKCTPSAHWSTRIVIGDTYRVDLALLDVARSNG